MKCTYSVNLPIELIERLKERSRKTGVSASFFIEETLKHRIDVEDGKSLP